MCGIAGIVRYDVPGRLAANRARAMQRALAHRGPDDQGLYITDCAALVHTRLALVDIERGRQPLTSPDGRYTIVYNGEVYNFRELREELRPGWDFRTDCDTEVVLAAYIEWGEGAFERFNGMFAFFIWDARELTGVGARDLLGVKPLAYAQSGDELLFASEARAILAARASAPRVDIEALLEYLVAPYFSGVAHSMFEGIEYLQPGHALEVSPRGLTVHAWGEYDPRGDFLEGGARLEARLGDSIARAVERSLRADVPVGAYLSGGLDSTLLTALAARAVEAPLKTFTIRFAEQDRYDYARSLIVTSDDTPYAVRAAAELGVEHHLVQVDRDTLGGDLAEIARINDALPAWEQELAQHYLARAARRHTKAVLVGDAADETHYGYHFLLDEDVTRSPAGILERFYAAPIRRDVLEDPVAHFEQKYLDLTTAAGCRWDTPLDRTLATTWLIIRRWLPRLLHNGDIHAMAASLEARVPFADLEILHLTRRIHPRLAYQDGVEKSLLRRAARGVVPEAVRTRKKSALPKDQHVGAVYQREARLAIDAAAAFLGAFLSLDRLSDLCDARRPLAEAERALLFRVIALSHWSRVHGVRPP